MIKENLLQAQYIKFRIIFSFIYKVLMNVFMPNLYLRLNGEKHVTICDSHTHTCAHSHRDAQTKDASLMAKSDMAFT